MGTTIRAGDLFAGRYRLTVLLDESGNGRFWRARDEVLARSVALHMVDRADPRATALLDAARRSARVQDRRLLRVLDGDLTDEFCYVVNEWGEGLSLDLRLADSGPLSPRRAAWIVSEFADTLAHAHAVGEAHGRVVPENLLLDRHGQVRVIGFAVDAALRGEAPGTAESDVADTGALLYAALTGKWAGRARSSVPAAPRAHGHVLRARQVQAGVPRTLDLICEDLVTDTSRSRVTHSAQGLSQLLAAFVGDAQDMVSNEPDRPHRDALVARPARRGDSDDTVAVPRVAPAAAVPPVAPVPPAPDENDDGPATEAIPFVPSPLGPSSTVADTPTRPAPRAAAAFEATAEVDQRELLAETPNDPDDPINDLSWLTPRHDAPPAPRLPEPTTRPLFAPEPPPGQPQRRARADAGLAGEPATFVASPGAHQASAHASHATDTGLSSGAHEADDPHWPWDADKRDDAVPGRRWYRLAVVVGILALVLLLAVAVKEVLGGSEPPAAPTPSGSPSATATAKPVQLKGLSVSDFDPEGTDGGRESPDLVGLVTDGDPSTAWRTSSYRQNFTSPNRLKPGVGLLVDLGEQRSVTQVQVQVLGGRTTAALYLTQDRPTSVDGLEPVGSQTGTSTLRFTTVPGTTGRWALVWLTSLPQDGSNYRGQIAEIKVFARP